MYSIKKRLKNGEKVLGTMISEIRNPNIAYILSQCGFDFFIIDNEHGTYSFETLSGMVAAARGAHISVIVRIPEITREHILKTLDLGAAGLLVPMVNNAAQAREIVSHAKYPPMGNRGAALRRPHNIYAKVNANEYLAQANQNTFIAVQAETTEAVKNIDEIVAVDGVDCVFVGPFDLSISLGIPGQINNKKEKEAIEKIATACKKNNKAAGILMFDKELLQYWINKGFTFALYSSDISMLADASAEAIKELKNKKN